MAVVKGNIAELPVSAFMLTIPKHCLEHLPSDPSYLPTFGNNWCWKSCRLLTQNLQFYWQSHSAVLFLTLHSQSYRLSLKTVHRVPLVCVGVAERA